MKIEEFAPAKVNLTLHVTGRRADGYHLLDSLVVFAGVGDRVTVEASDALSLTLAGPEAAGLVADRDNLVLKAARFFDPGFRARITLWKALPVASGIGGGSADAAATLRALSRLTGRPLPAPGEAATLGADVPACLRGRALRLRGIGELLEVVPRIPPFEILLVNPRVTVPTPSVFASLTERWNPAMNDDLPDWPDVTAFCAWLRRHRNDLSEPARRVAPVIDDVLALVRETGCLHAGMSGSGATCFGLYPADGSTAAAAEAFVRLRRPDWWSASGAVS
ncbi:4-diphosphocytidyl-2-C-methyl-D-erythritol kinase [Defluviimonas aquaemixtae]|uniref:4-diphosphocytidyl-2-C-methyl-D-erythritol kinase n=1 Tax=Albidovulum aquaemixtae TaxID=1542388 RepID=A0A2R8BJ49_9RHOB|nr:4-(cytidine 5'-diphospho)-2-C-methyl-D-erythritol kinase [Defluviimonas aquaemixtae]SPH23376.1 4-diphosphocytidyl-2-C-methyl-D-erythritol kinase [Defluviimonas aquaemixtae]